MRLRTALLVAFLAGSPVAADLIPVAVELRPGETTVGGRVRAKLTLVWDGDAPSADPRFPEWEDGWGDAEVLEVSEVEAFPDQSGRFVYIQELTLTAFEVGEVKLPKQTVALPLADETVEIPTEEESFQVVTVLPQPGGEGQEGTAGAGAAPGADAAAGSLELRPPASLIAPDTTRRFLLTTLVLSILTVLAVHVLLTRLGRIRPLGAAGQALLPPLDELLQRLAGLENATAEPAHTGLSLALRTYLGRSLGLHAVESTTTEIQRRLRHSPAPAAAAQQVVGLLRDCDQVKFAGVDVAPVVVAERVGKTRHLARDIEEELRARQVDGDGDQAAARRQAELERLAMQTRRRFRTWGRWTMALAAAAAVAGLVLVWTEHVGPLGTILLIGGGVGFLPGLLAYHRGRR